MIRTTKSMFEILLVLFSGRNLNLNSIARKAGISAMGVSKIIKKLEKGNVVTVSKIGRSHAVRLIMNRDNLELFSLSEKYRFEKFIAKYPKLRGFLMQLREKVSALADFSLIFGSYASDEVSSNSDLDLLIVSSSKDVYKIINEISILLDISVSPIIVGKGDFIKQAKKGHRLYKEIVNGKRILISGEYEFWSMLVERMPGLQA